MHVNARSIISSYCMYLTHTQLMYVDYVEHMHKEHASAPITNKSRVNTLFMKFMKSEFTF